jgi:hypothetical protein
MKIPNIDSMLPSAAKSVLAEYFLAQIIAKGVDYRGAVQYHYVEVLREVDVGTFAHSIAHDCYQAALSAFDKKYPLRRDKKLQAYREGL